MGLRSDGNISSGSGIVAESSLVFLTMPKHLWILIAINPMSEKVLEYMYTFQYLTYKTYTFL